MSAKKIVIRKNAYFDSVSLMQIGQSVRKGSGILNAVVGMATDFNIDSLKRLNLYASELDAATPNDLVIAVEGIDDGAAEAGAKEAERLLSEKKTSKGDDKDFEPVSLSSAIAAGAGTNVVLISLPGRFAAREVRTALQNDHHVMLFSDNVTVDEEIELKELAVSKGLLMMGPDCGTAIINGVPLAFANVVRRGDIGVVAASGTGLQEVTSLIHQFGCGISHAIGVGGRDLSEKVGGRMTLLAARALAEDPATKVILMVSKPPHPKTEDKLFAELKSIKKPVVVYFIGADPEKIRKAGFEPAENLENAAARACMKSSGGKIEPLVSDDELRKKAAGLKLSGKYLRGLFSGGTLCDEAQRILLPVLGKLQSNTPVPGAEKMADIYKSEGHCIIDLGDDDFTRGRPHPMIDPSTRVDRIKEEFADPNIAMIIIDVVLGFGSHRDMAGEMVSAVELARKSSGRNPLVAATICGTDGDPQDYKAQAEKLRQAGIQAFPSNAALSKFTALIMGGGR